MLFPKLPKRPVHPKGPTIGGIPATMGELRRFVLTRDGGCVLVMLRYGGHVCRGRFDSVPYHDRDFTLEHVVGVHGFADVRRDDEQHTVGLCYGTNIDHTSKGERERIREHLVALYPECLSSTRGGDG